MKPPREKKPLTTPTQEQAKELAAQLADERRRADDEARTIVAIVQRHEINGSPKWVTPDGVAFIEKLARGGHTKRSISAKLRVDHKTLAKIADRQPEVAEALEAGRALHEADLVDALTARALAGDVVPALFLLKARHGWREGDARDGGGAQVNVQVIQLAAPMTPEQYGKLIDAEEPASISAPADLDGGT